MRRAITFFFLLSAIASAADQKGAAAEKSAAAGQEVATEKQIAEWVLRWEGEVTVQGRPQPLRDVDQIPPGDIHITGIDLTAVVMHPAELRKLHDLPYLRQLYLPGPIWNPGGGKEDRSAAAGFWLDL